MEIRDAVTWEQLRLSLGTAGMAVLNDIWYNGQPLTRARGNILAATFRKYPLGQTNFKAWVKRTTRQLFENNIRRQGYAFKAR